MIQIQIRMIQIMKSPSSPYRLKWSLTLSTCFKTDQIWSQWCWYDQIGISKSKSHPPVLNRVTKQWHTMSHKEKVLAQFKCKLNFIQYVSSTLQWTLHQWKFKNERSWSVKEMWITSDVSYQFVTNIFFN